MLHWAPTECKIECVYMSIYDDVLSRRQSRVCLHLYDEVLSLLGLARTRAPTPCNTVYVWYMCAVCNDVVLKPFGFAHYARAPNPNAKPNRGLGATLYCVHRA